MANGKLGKSSVRNTPEATSVQKTPKGTPKQKTPKGTPMQKTPKGTPMPKTPKGTPVQKMPKGKPTSVKKQTPKKAQKMDEEEDDEEFDTGDEDDGDDDLDISDDDLDMSDDDLGHDSDSEEEVPNPVLAGGKAGKAKLTGKKSKTKKVAEESVEKEPNPDLDAKIAKTLADGLKHEEKRRADRDRRVLFVNNLPDNTTEDMLMSLADGIEEVRLKYSKNKLVPPYAFLFFKTEVIAKEQFKKLSSTKLGEKEINVDFVGEKSHNKKEQKAVKLLKPSDIDPRRLHITGFGPDVIAEDLFELFTEASDITLPLRVQDNQPLAYGFVTFPNRRLAQEAHENLQGKLFRSHVINIMFAKRRKEKSLKADERKNGDIDPRRLHITEASDIKLPVRNKQSQGYGSVEFPDRQLAQDAHENLQGKLVPSHAINMFAKRRKEKSLKAQKRNNEQEKKVEETKSGASAAKKAKKDTKTKKKL